MDAPTIARPAAPARLMDQVRFELRHRSYDARTADAYLHWIRRFILFHGKAHPRDLGEEEVTAFLDRLSAERAPAREALHFLYRHVLATPLRLRQIQNPAAELGEAALVRALERLEGSLWVVAALLQGTDLVLEEVLRLRVREVDFLRQRLVVRDPRGVWQRDSELPKPLLRPLQDHLERVRGLHCQDLAQGFGRVSLPPSVARQHPRAECEWGWQYLFPRRTLETTDAIPRRSHLHADRVRRQLQRAAARSLDS